MINKYRNKVLLRNLSVRFITGLFISGLMFGVSQSANAAGFAIAEQSGTGLGNAYAGGAASAEDASTIWYNPAGMTRLKGSNAVVAIHSITPSMKFKDNGSTSSVLVGSPASTGSDGGDAGVSAVVPNIYFSTPLSSDITFGAAINAPFGLSTEYDKTWKGRYFGVESAIEVVNLNTSLGFKVDEHLSLGVGLNLQKMEVLLSKAINQLAVCNAVPGLGTVCGTGVGSTPATDGFAEVEGTSNSWGANLGLMYEFNDAMRLGFAYRSVVRHKIKGDGKFTDVNVALDANGFFQNTDASADITLPATASVSYYQDIMSNLALMADVTWTEWSQLDEVRIQYRQGTQGDTVEELGWSNTMRYAVGATYRPIPALALRAGVALDGSPVTSARKRTVRLPDNDRLWLSVGVGYEVIRGLELDVSYTSITMDDAEIDANETLNGNLKGDYKLSTNILSAQANWSF